MSETEIENYIDEPPFDPEASTFYKLAVWAAFLGYAFIVWGDL